MNIVIIGTSNSVVGERGYIEVLRRDHNITQLSVGRVPFFYHIKSIIENKKQIEKADLLIIDHYVNDLNFYLGKLDEDYLSLCNHFYKLLSALNTNVINLLFPVNHQIKSSFENYYSNILYLSKKYSLSVLNLNELNLKEFFFKDDIHITKNASYILGLWLTNLLNLNKLLKPAVNGLLKNVPFKVYSLKNEFPKSNCLNTFSTSLMSIDYMRLESPITIKVPKSYKLLSLGFVNPKGSIGCSGLKLNDMLVGLEGIGYYHEAINFDIYGDVTLSTTNSNENLINLFNRGESDLLDPFANISELMFFDTEGTFDVSSAQREVIKFDLSDLQVTLERLLMPTSRKLSNKTIDFLRDLAIEHENSDLNLAHDIMSILNFIRPSGHYIEKKLRNYELLESSIKVNERK